ncbi:hypothetical protein VUR80DRAFT_9701 [Thermomyces stellatus]
MSHPQSVFKESAFVGRSLLSTRRDTISKVTVHEQLDLLKSTGRYDCFKLQWHPVYDDKSSWPFLPHLFWDSDIAKWIEGACYFLHEEYDERIDGAVRELVEMIRGAQGEDGYLNLHYTVVEPDKRWTNLRDMHELYNAGHFIEAALAHQDYYKDNRLLDPMLRYVSYIRKTFGPGPDQIHGYPGHPEIELALLRLHSATGSQDAYDLARFFLEERGKPDGQDGQHYYEWERERRGESRYERPDCFPESRGLWYLQAHAPIVEQNSVEGHAVRCMYLLTGAADMLCLDRSGSKPLPESEKWSAALRRLWDNMVDKKMYVTGGIGAMKQWEGFGIDYFLPQGTDEGGCYSETCASIAVMMFAERLLHLDLDGRYGDVMELSLYNTVMTAMNLTGRGFTYVNQLASSEADPSKREEWFVCACCPPNLMRVFGCLGGYLWDYGESSDGAFVNVHLYTSAKMEFDTKEGRMLVEQTSDWPWESEVAFKVSSPVKTTMRLRLPAWSKGGYSLTPTPSSSETSVAQGYLELSPSYIAAHPSFTLKIHNLAPRYIAPHPHTNQHTLTLARGPIVYCAEDADNPWEQNHFKDIVLKRGSPVSEETREAEATGEKYVALKTKCWRREVGAMEEGCAGEVGETNLVEEREIVLVPYYIRANRGGKGHMRVGFVRGD